MNGDDGGVDRWGFPDCRTNIQPHCADMLIISHASTSLMLRSRIHRNARL
jgi:hypothetical protein